MRKPEFYSAVYWIIKNEKGEFLFQRRQNTWFRDWYFQLSSWHVEWEELMKDSLIREIKEEINIDIDEKDIELVHISHRITKNNRVYFDCYFDVKKYSWELKNNEIDKCSEIKFVDINNIVENEKHLFWYDLDVIKKIEKWEKFSELIL